MTPKILLFLFIVSLGTPSWLVAQIDSSPLDSVVIQSEGRQKPFPVFKKETFQTLVGTGPFGMKKFKPSFSDRKMDAGEVMLSIWFSPDRWMDEEVILVEYQPLRKLLGMEKDKKLSSFGSIVTNPKFISAFEEIQRIKRQNPNAKLDPLQKEIEAVSGRLHIFEGLLSGTGYRVIPPSAPGTVQFLPVQLVASAYPRDKAEPVMAAFDRMRQDFLKGDNAGFRSSAAQFAQAVSVLNPKAVLSPALVKTENLYEGLHPFRWAWIAFLLGFIALLAVPDKKKGYTAAWIFVIAGFILQLAGFVMRIAISQRAPVTNMYETVIWLAFGITLLAIIFEWKYKCRYYLLGALPVAILSLLLADSLPNALDNSIRPLMPVLQHNFWLTVHVLTITSSYAAFALALGVAHIILGKVLLTRKHKVEASLYNYLYKTLQIGVLLLAIGTILGAVWANYSWGRFWDWDPKETWALVAFLSYLFVLHGRIAGWWGGFGLAVGSVIGFLAVLMAWYGVNFVLGVGLHSYGFGAGGVEYAVAFVVVELIFTAASLFVYLKIKNQDLPKTPAPV